MEHIVSRGVWIPGCMLLLFSGLPWGGPLPRSPEPAVPVTGLQVNTQDRSAVIAFYQRFYMASEGVKPHWTGDVASCDPGTVSAEFNEALLRRINYFRAMAAVPADVVFSDELNGKCQQAALMILANQQLSHSPPPTWICYRAGGAEAVGKSNLYFSNGNSPSPAFIVDGYIEDPGTDNSSVGHRRWLLFPRQRSMGSGTAENGDSANAIWVVGDFTPGPKVRSAWPPAGYVPRRLIFERWSFSYPRADFSKATVEMMETGRPVTLRIIHASGRPTRRIDGDNTIVWVPNVPSKGTDGDVTFRVAVRDVLVDGKPKHFVYEVTAIDVGQ
jgi:uncharacterized protein YkwD